VETAPHSAGSLVPLVLSHGDIEHTSLVLTSRYLNCTHLRDQFQAALPAASEGLAGDAEPASPTEQPASFLGFTSALVDEEPGRAKRARGEVSLGGSLEKKTHTVRAKRARGVWGISPQDIETGGWNGWWCSGVVHSQSVVLWTWSSDSAPSEARKRGSGGGFPRKYDDLLTGLSDLDIQPRR
jgi:hypothetical protein